jgi:histidyl-tRNA synthetase
VNAPRAPKGTYDLLPDEAARRDRLVATAARVFAAHGYRRAVTPEFEETGLFERGVGEATDIVRKEMYTFTDKGGRSLTLRPEGTAPICRLYVEHGLHKWPQPVKLWYYAPMFRYERPQAGRFREHYQLGAEAIGSAAPEVDAEIVAMLARLFDELGIGDLRLAVNSMGDTACRPAYVGRLRDYLRGREEELCGDCRERLELNPLRTFDCKVETCRAVLDAAPHIDEHLCPDCRAHFDTVLDLLRRVGLDPQLDFRLVRGLDYYTRTTFEFSSELLGAQSGVGGGGRYDGLVEQIGGPPTPGVGFGSGLERITLAMGEREAPVAAPAAFVVAFTDERRGDAFVLAQELRRAGLGVELDLGARSVKGQLKQAGRSGAVFAVLLGLEGQPPDTVRVKGLAGGGEEDVPAAALAGWLTARVVGDGADPESAVPARTPGPEAPV